MKTFLRILLLVVVATATAIAIFYAWTDWAGARHWKAVEADLRAKGEPLSVAEFIPKPIPDEMNFAAAPIFAEVQKDSDGTKWRISQIKGFKGGYRKGSTQLASAARSVDPKFSGSDAEAARVILTQMDRWKPLLDEVREAAQRPGTDWKLDYSTPYHMRVDYLTILLNLSQAFSTEAKAYIEIGDSAAALADFDFILGLSERTVGPPLLIGHFVRMSLIGMGIDVLKYGIDRHAWTELQLKAIQRTLAHISLQPELINSLRLERTFFNDAFLDSTRVGVEAFFSLSEESAPRDKALARIFWALRPAGWSNEDRCAYSEGLQSIIDDVTSAPLTLRMESSQPHGIVAIILHLWRTPFTAIALPSEEGAIKNTFWHQSLVNEACTACAIERYRLAHGMLPPDLNALCPEFLTAVPLDPMSGQPLHYKPGQGDSYILYGVGWNQKDDGGSEQGGRSSEAIDWVWKIGNPS